MNTDDTRSQWNRVYRIALNRPIIKYQHEAIVTADNADLAAAALMTDDQIARSINGWAIFNIAFWRDITPALQALDYATKHG